MSFQFLLFDFIEELPVLGALGQLYSGLADRQIRFLCLGGQGVGVTFQTGIVVRMEPAFRLGHGESVRSVKKRAFQRGNLAVVFLLALDAGGMGGDALGESLFGLIFKLLTIAQHLLKIKFESRHYPYPCVNTLSRCVISDLDMQVAIQNMKNQR